MMGCGRSRGGSNHGRASAKAASGFADQAHMIGTMRLNTRFAPGQMRQRAGADEAFWSYRLAGQYFDESKF